MTKKSFLLILTMGVLINLASCDWLNIGGNKEETDPEKTMGKVDNFWTVTTAGYSNATITIVDNEDGNVVANLSYDGDSYEVEGKITDKGIYDYVYSNGDKSKPFTLVKFDAEVGDRWEYKVGNQTVVREVVKKSTTDDTPYGFMYVKTVDVLETIPEGVHVKNGMSQASQILWKFNHKFGFIAAEVTALDGSTTTVNQYDTNANSN